MTERTLIFHRATLPDETVLLARPSLITVQAVARNDDGAIIGQHIYTLDPWQVDRYQFGLGAPTGQNRYRHAELTVFRADSRETIELGKDSALIVEAVSTNEDGHRTQPYQYRVPVEGLEGIDVGEYRLKPAGRNHSVLGLVVGKQAVTDQFGQTVGWLPVYNDIKVPETAAV